MKFRIRDVVVLTVRDPAVGADLAVADVQLPRREAFTGTAGDSAADGLEQKSNTLSNLLEC